LNETFNKIINGGLSGARELDQNFIYYLIAWIKICSRIKVSLGLNICKMVRVIELIFNFFNLMLYFFHVDMICSLLDPKLVDLKPKLNPVREYINIGEGAGGNPLLPTWKLSGQIWDIKSFFTDHTNPMRKRGKF